MIIIKCNNKACQHTFRIEDRLDKGGINDACILEVECPICQTLTYIPSYNFCRKAFIDGGKVKKVIEGRLHEHPELPYPEMLTAPEGVELKESKVRWSIKGYNLWRSTSHEFEMQATYLLCRNKSQVTEKMQSYTNCFLNGHGPSVAFYIQDYKLGKFKAQAVWAKDTESSTDLNTKGYYLVHH